MGSGFYLAYFLLVASESYYFGMKIGLYMSLLTVAAYSLTLFIHPIEIDSKLMFLRVSFIFLLYLSSGMLSLVEKKDKEKIREKNK